MEVLNILRSYHIPVNSYIAAIQYLNDKGTLSTSEYVRRVEEITGHENISLDKKYARHIYLYLVQEVIRESYHTDIFDMERIMNVATGSAIHFVDNNPEIFAEKKELIKHDHEGNPKAKKGVKKELSKQVYLEQIKGKGISRKQAIEIFVKEVKMTPAGASTYYANCKKKFGP